MAFKDWIGSGLSFLGGVLGSGIDYAVAKQNQEISEKVNAQNLAYQREQAEITRQREDTAAQRSALDFQKAGLSKTLAAGNTASANYMSPYAVNPSLLDYKHNSALEKAQLGHFQLANKQANASIVNTNADTLVKNLTLDKLLSEIESQKISNANAILNGEIMKYDYDYFKKRDLPTNGAGSGTGKIVSDFGIRFGKDVVNASEKYQHVADSVAEKVKRLFMKPTNNYGKW